MKNHSFFHSHGMYLLFIVILTIGVYFPALDNGYSKLDDVMIIENNWDNLHRFSYAQEAFFDDIFQEKKGSYYRPVQILSYMLDCYVFGHDKDNPMPFLLSNIILFLLNSLLLYGFLIECKIHRQTALISLTIIVLHPTVVPAVAWIPGKIELYLFLFFLLNVWSAKRYFAQGNPWALVPFLLTYLLGLFNKETAIVLPLAGFLIYLYYCVEEWSFSSLSFWKNTLLKFVKQHIGFIALVIAASIFYLYMRFTAIPETEHGGGYMLFMLPYFIVNAIIYPGTFLWNYDLPVFHEPRWKFVVLPALALLLLTYIFANKVKRNKMFQFGLIWYFLFLLPTFMANKIVYHRMYVPLIGLPFILEAIDWKLLFNARWKKGVYIIGFLLWLLIHNLHFQQSFDNKYAYWKNAEKHASENVVTQRGIAYLFHCDGQYDSALVHYQKAYEADSSVANTLLCMGITYNELELYALSDAMMYKELKSTIDTEYVAFTFGNIYVARGDSANAIKWYTTAYEHSGKNNYLLHVDSVRQKLFPTFH